MEEPSRELSFSLPDKEFNYICEFVYEKSGIVLNSSKREMVYRRLTRVIRERKLSSFSEYCQLLKDNNESETNYFINAITTNLTSFFREKHHFDYLISSELPKLLEVNKQNKKIRIWCSACSTGEEPYSIATVIYEVCSLHISTWDIKILATDIDSDVINKAKLGVYDKCRVEDIQKKYIKNYFIKGTGQHENKIKVNPKLQKLITFKQLNLLHEWPMKGPFDIIFCRNVIIYFDKETQELLFERLYNMLIPGGVLILGHSESLGKYNQYFENIGRTIFRKPMV